jgi:hypothetical protein
MEVRDYNGEGDWSKNEIIRRYVQYCREMKVKNPIDLSPVEFSKADVKWIYPVMYQVIEGIEQGDVACRRIGVEFMEADGKFPFDRNIKYRTARALRRSELTEQEKDRIRRRLVGMLISGKTTRVFKEHARLLKKIGVGDYWSKLENEIDQSKQHVMRFYNYLKSEK